MLECICSIPVCLQVVFEVSWVGEGPVAALIRAAVDLLRRGASDSGLGLTAVDVVSAVACVSGQLCSCGGDQTVVSQLLDPQIPRRSAITAVSGRNLLLRLVHIVLNEHQRLGRQPCNTSTASEPGTLLWTCNSLRVTLNKM